MYVILFNPISGNHDSKQTKKEIRHCLHLHNKEYVFIETQKDGSHAKKVREYHDEIKTIFIAVGGDGTVSELINILFDIKPLIGIIPTGSANSLARELNIPLNVVDACNLILTSTKVRKLGVLSAFDKFFILDISVGVNALVMRDTTRPEKRSLGLMAYIKHAMRWILTFKAKTFKITIDNKVYKRKATDVIVANGGIIKSLLKRIAGYPELSRQYFDVIIIRTRSAKEYFRMIFSFILGPLNSDEAVEIIKVKKTVKIECQKELPVQGDGEIIGKVPVSLTLHNRAFSVIIPEETK